MGIKNIQRSLIVIASVVAVVFGDCKDEIAQNSEVQDCVMDFVTYLQNMGSSMDMSNENAAFEMICSPEGKKVFHCILKYVVECPAFFEGQGDGTNPMEALNSLPGFNIQTFMSEGGLDGACALMVGPCSEVKNCYTVSEGGMMKRGAVDTTPGTLQYYSLFRTSASQICVGMNDQMKCVLDALEHCPESVVDQVESEFEKAIQISIPREYGIVSFKDTKMFYKQQCPNMPENIETDACITEVLASDNFTTCTSNVTSMYSKKKTCEIHAMNKKCVMDNMESKCGQNTANFFAQNSHVIFPGVPSNCESLIAGSDGQKSSFGVLLMFLLLSLLFVH